MEKDIAVTPVVFRKFSDGEVIALFPDLCGSDWTNVASYIHIGQHGSADWEIVSSTKLAKESEYKDLFEELESIGYNLKVVTRKTSWMDQKRWLDYKSAFSE